MRLTLVNAIRWHSYASSMLSFLFSSLTHKGCADVAPFRCNDFLRVAVDAGQSKHTCSGLVRFACRRRCHRHRVLASSILFCLLFVPYVFMACKMCDIVDESESCFAAGSLCFTLQHFASFCFAFASASLRVGGNTPRRGISISTVACIISCLSLCKFARKCSTV